MYNKKDYLKPRKQARRKEVKMKERYKTVLSGGVGELTEKKSRFIATVRLTETEEEALSFIEEMKKKYWDARHNCYAYTIGENREFTRCSDDGEPSGTAGRPMLDVLLGEELYNVTVVVTRYFGGVLLGTGGLVRAYSGAVREGLAGSRIIEKISGCALKVTTDYNGIGKLQYLVANRNYPILNTEYTEIVRMELLVPERELSSAQKALTEATSGKAVMEKDRDLYYALLDGKVLTFPA